MPSGKTHFRFNLMMLAVWAGLCALLLQNEYVVLPSALIFSGCYVFSMCLMSPDLDLARSDAFRRWGFLRWVWFPYAWIFKHRQVSHHLVIGPFTRILYIIALAAVLTGVYVAISGNPWPRVLLSADVLLASFAGLYLPNLQHILADRASTAWRRKRRRHRL